ncbi:MULTISPECIES: hypothetical protein [unclassified Shewanella]|uniref:hypothetical protein n=2 Tax=Shewanellaceae TaxID=267890 RepID=UPI0016042D73|nr:hypothetical protein [Shewanella sp. SR43-8]MBB1323800.1 hypothetical protein [Shewanella sp. SR43-8]
MSRMRIITVMLILMTFVSQAFASVILPCPSDMNSMLSKSNPVNTAATNACHHQLTSDADAVKTSTADIPDCCDNQCDCPIGTCFSIALEMKIVQSVTISSLSSFISGLTQNTTPQYNSSLYRPPIFSC